MKKNLFKTKVLITLGMGLTFSAPATVCASMVSSSPLSSARLQLIDSTKNVFSYDDQIMTSSELPITPRLSFDTFYGGVTGVPGLGTVWGEFHPRSRKVAVQAKGKTTKTVTANAGGKAYASVSRALTGNTSGWWWV